MTTDRPSGATSARHVLREIALSCVDSVRRNPLRNFATAAGVVAMLLPYLVGIGIARGLSDDIADTISHGEDLHVDGEDASVPALLPRAVWEAVARVPGVTHVTPRIVAPIALGRRSERVVLVGLPPDALPTDAGIVRGRLVSAGADNEVVIGSAVARDLALDVGSRIPPFYRNADGERVTTVVGVFRPDAPVWQAHLMLTSFATASQFLDRPDVATDLLVDCGDADVESVAAAIRMLDVHGDGGSRAPSLLVSTRTDLAVLAPRELVHTEGLYHGLFALVFAAGIPIVLVTSGVGLRGRRRESGLLRATGWRADEVLLRSVVENVTVAVTAAGVAVLLAWLWLAALGGIGIAPVFLPGAASEAAAVVPFRLTPLPVLLGLALAVTLVLVGSVPATWRAVSAPPARAME